MRSFSRLIDRRNVDFPQPDGPISAVTARGETARSMSSRAWFFPYQKLNCWAAIEPSAGRLPAGVRRRGSATALIRIAR
jgi:hypothetical protein